MLAGVQDALTEVMVGDTCKVLLPPPPPPQPAEHSDPRRERVSKILRIVRASSGLIVRGEFDRLKYSTVQCASRFFR
jgi:hypothetical protein